MKPRFQIVGSPELGVAAPRVPVVGYARKSTDRDGVQEMSLSDQRDAIQFYCKMYGLGEPVIFEEKKSAKNLSGRPVFQQILAMCAAGQTQHLVVTEITRLSRDLGDTRHIFDALEKQGVQVHGANRRIDSTTADGKFTRDLEALLGERERRILGERIKRALAAKRARGESTGHAPPYGWRHRGHKGRKVLVPYAPEQATLRLVRDWVAQGMKATAIKRELFKRRIQPRSGRTVFSHYALWLLMHKGAAKIHEEKKSEEEPRQTDASAGAVIGDPSL